MKHELNIHQTIQTIVTPISENDAARGDNEGIGFVNLKRDQQEIMTTTSRPNGEIDDVNNEELYYYNHQLNDYATPNGSNVSPGGDENNVDSDRNIDSTKDDSVEKMYNNDQLESSIGNENQADDDDSVDEMFLRGDGDGYTQNRPTTHGTTN